MLRVVYLSKTADAPYVIDRVQFRGKLFTLTIYFNLIGGW